MAFQLMGTCDHNIIDKRGTISLAQSPPPRAHCSSKRRMRSRRGLRYLVLSLIKAKCQHQFTSPLTVQLI
jgi:hypothetical protein